MGNKVVAVVSIVGFVFGIAFLAIWPNKTEAILVGLLIMGTITALNQVEEEIKEGKRYSYGVDPYRHLFTPMPEGTFSANQPFKKAFAWFGAIVALMGFGWLGVNVPEMAMFAMVYMVMALIVMIVVLVEEISPTKSEITACMLFGYGDWEDQILWGIVIAIPFIAFMATTRMELFQIKGMPIASFIITAIMVPMVEEALFRGVIAPSIAEDAGVIHGALISAFAFAMFHAYVYQFDWVKLGFAFAFGVVAALVDFKYKSILPSSVAHTLINGLVYINWLMGGGG